jgi:hypothetical protein
MRITNLILTALLILFISPVHCQLKVKTDGYVGIGTNDPQSNLHVIGQGLIDSYEGSWGCAFTTRVHYQNSSSYSLWNGYYNREVFFVNGEGWLWSIKEHYVGSDSLVIADRESIDSPLDAVMQLEGVKFRYAEERSPVASKPYRLGLVAQEVERVVPEVVKIMPDSSMAISYEELVPLLIEALKEQQGLIESLQASIYRHEEQISRLKKRRRYRGIENE